MKTSSGVIFLALLLAGASQFTSAVAAPSADQLEAAIIAGDWRSLAESTPGDAIGHFAKAAANGVMGNYRIMSDEFDQSKSGGAEIDEFCAELLKRAGNNGYAHFVAGIRLYEKGETERALSEYKAAIKLNPQFSAPYLEIGKHYGQKLHNHSEEMAWIDRAVAADPSYPPAYATKGSAYNDVGRRDLAIPEFKKAIALLEAAKISKGQSIAWSYYNLGLMLLTQSPPDTEGGMALMKKAIAADPFTLQAYTELGIAYKRRGQFAEAVETYKNAIRRGANGATLYFNLGVAEYRSGDSAGAKAAFEKAVALDPGGQAGSQARQWLGQIQ